MQATGLRGIRQPVACSAYQCSTGVEGCTGAAGTGRAGTAAVGTHYKEAAPEAAVAGEEAGFLAG